MKTPTLDKIGDGAIRSLTFDQRLAVKREVSELRKAIDKAQHENEAALKRAEEYEHDTTGRRIIVEFQPEAPFAESLFIAAECEKPGRWVSTFASNHFHETRDHLIMCGDGVEECPGCGRTWWGQHQCECGKTLIDLEPSETA